MRLRSHLITPVIGALAPVLIFSVVMVVSAGSQLHVAKPVDPTVLARTVAVLTGRVHTA